MRVLICHRGPDLAGELRERISAAGHRVLVADIAADILAGANGNFAPDVLIVVCDVPPRETIEQLAALTARSPLPVVLVTGEATRHSMADWIRAGVSAHAVAGRFALPVDALLEFAVARFAEDQRLRVALKNAESQLVDRKRIERAKGILMRERGCAEDEAYRTLRKLAMDRNLKLGEVAEQLISIEALLRG